MPVDRSFAESQDKRIDLAAERIGKYLSRVMRRDLAYTVEEVQEMVDDFAKEDKELGHLAENVPWYKFTGGSNPITILQGTSKHPYYAVRKK